MTMKHRLAALAALAAVAAVPQAAYAVYLNDANITVALGPSMSAEPFANRATAPSLASIIDADTAASSELHNQSTHVWVSGGPLELVFDFQLEYDLTTLHFWNYHTEGFDVDNINFNFYDASNALVGSLLNVVPALGGGGSDSIPIFAQDYLLSFPSRVRYVNALLTGSNGQVDFNNIGFTGTRSDPNPDPDPGVTVSEPGTLALVSLGLLGGLAARRRRKI